MKVFSGFEKTPNDIKGAVIAMGAFDGLHIGHKTLLEIAHKTAPNAPLGLLLFDPPPKLFFAKDHHGMRIATQRVTERLAAKSGVEVVFTLNFDAELAAMPATDFVQNVVIDGLCPKHIVVGHDFRYGKGRTGDALALKQKCEENGIGVTIVEPVNDNSGERISSSRIKAALKLGDIALANKLLGHPWTLEGIVEHGQKLGRQLGFPTANLKLYDQVEPLYGIYAVRVDLGDKVLRMGVANFGRTPTTGIRDPLFEVHILDFDGDIYDRNIFVEVIEFLREEENYPGLDELVAQIKIDAANARRILSEA